MAPASNSSGSSRFRTERTAKVANGNRRAANSSAGVHRSCAHSVPYSVRRQQRDENGQQGPRRREPQRRERALFHARMPHAAPQAVHHG